MNTCQMNTSHMVLAPCTSPLAYRVDGSKPPRVGLCLRGPAWRRSDRAGSVNLTVLPFPINTTASFPPLHLAAAFLFPLLPSTAHLLSPAFCSHPQSPPPSIPSPLCSTKASMSLHPAHALQDDCFQSNEELYLKSQLHWKWS